MALLRVTTWSAGQQLTAAALNAEFNNILNNPISLLFPATGTMNANNQQVTNLVLEKLAADPSAATAGRVYWNTATTQLKVDAGATVYTIGPSTAPAQAVGSRVTGLYGTLSSNLGTFTANQYMLQTTNPYTNSFMLASTASFSVNSRTAGPAANGRDVVGALGSTVVYWYAISTGASSTTPAGIVSSQPPTVGPVLPTSYSAWAFLGASLYSTASSGVAANHYQRGAWTYYNPERAAVLTSATAETSQSLASYVPPSANNIQVHTKFIGTVTTSDGLSIAVVTRAASAMDGLTIESILPLATTGTVATQPHVTGRLPNLNTPPSVYTAATVTYGLYGGATVYVQGYDNPNGDV